MDPMKRLSAFLYGFAPTSTLLCSVDGDPPAEGGGQAPQQPPPAPAQPASPPQFTPEQLAWIEAEKTRASNAAAAAARRAEQERLGRRGGDPPATPAPTAQPNNPPPQGGGPTFDADAFNDALAEFPFDKEQRGEIRSAARRENPSDVDGFVAKWARMFGKAKPASPAPGSAAPVAAPPPAAPPPIPGVTSRGNPPPAAVPGDDVPILSMSIPERMALRQKIGDVAYAERNEREMKSRNVRVRPLV